MCGPFRGFSFLLVIDAVSESLKSEARIPFSRFFGLPALPGDATVCPDRTGSSMSPPCSEELDEDDDIASRRTFGVGPPNIWIHWSRGTDKRPEMESGYREMTFAGFIFNLTNKSSAVSNSPARNCDTASNALVRLVRLSFNNVSICKVSCAVW
jgi:hypothetical protein